MAQSSEFRSKFDGWLVGAIAGGFVIGAIALWAAWWSTRASGIWVGVSVYAVVLALVGWMLASTRYRVDGTALTVRCGPFRWRVPLDEIVGVEESRDPVSSPAWSLDRIKINYSRGRSLMVSPPDKERFIAALRRGASD